MLSISTMSISCCIFYIFFGVFWVHGFSIFFQISICVHHFKNDFATLVNCHLSLFAYNGANLSEFAAFSW